MYLEKVKILTKNLLLRGDGKILCLKRSKKDKRRPNCWDFPGGNLEAGEDIYVSASREILEETGLQVKEMQVIYVESGMGIEGVDVLALCFVTTEFEGEVKLSDEHSQFRWVKPSEFMEMETGNDGGFLHNCVKALVQRTK